METKHIVGLIAMCGLASVSALAMTMWPRARLVGLFALVFGAIISPWFDVNLFGQYWYRGTTRGVEISWVDCIAFGLFVSEMLMPRYERRRWLWPTGLGLFIVYLGYCTVSVVTAEPKLYGVWELANVFRATLVILAAAAVVRSRRELGVVVLALACAVCVEAVYGFKQRFVSGIYRVPGTFQHENTLSTYLCTVGPILLAAAFADWSKWLRWFCALACGVAFVTELLTISRAGIPIFVFVMAGVTFFCVTWRITRRKIAVGTLVLGAAMALFAATWDQIKARYASASLEEEYLSEDSEGRGVYFRWAFMMADDSYWGVGLNNWSYYVSKVYGAELGFRYEDYDDISTSPEKADLPAINYAAPAHSLVALTLGELGIPGVIVIGLVWLRWFQMGVTFFRQRLNADPMHRLGIGCLFALAGVFLSNVTEWTYRQAGIIFTCHIVVGILASLHYARRYEFVEETEESDDDVGDDSDEIEIEAEVVPTSTR